MQMAANGLRYLRVGGRGQCLRCRNNSKSEKYLKTPQNPQYLVHFPGARPRRFVEHSWKLNTYPCVLMMYIKFVEQIVNYFDWVFINF